MAARSVVESHLNEEERIRNRAHEIYVSRGRQEGSALEDWLQAEREILGHSKDSAQDRATVVGSAARPSRELTDDLGRD